MGLHDHEIRLLRQVEEVFHFPDQLYVRVRGEGVYHSGVEDCFISQKEKAGHFGKESGVAPEEYCEEKYDHSQGVYPDHE